MHVRHRILLSVVLAAGVDLLARMAQSQSPPVTASDPTCHRTQWSTPVAVTRNEARPARFPAIVAGAEKTFVFGNDLEPTGFRPGAADVLVALEAGGGSVGQPPGEFTFVYPVASYDRSGRIQVVWGEDDRSEQAAKSRQAGLPMIHGLWAASYDPRAASWSAATRLFETSLYPPSWTFKRVRMLADDRGELTVSVLLSLPDRPEDLAAGRTTSSILRLHHDGERWSVSRSSLPGMAVEASAVDVGDREYVAYVGPASLDGRDNSVHFTSAPVGDEKLAPARLLARSRVATPANGIRLLRGPGSSLHLVWKQTLPVAPGGEVIRHLSSSDLGAHWSAPEDLIPGAPSGGEDYVVDRCDAMHTVFETVRGDAVPHLTYATWEGRWSPPTSPFAALASFDAAFTLAPDGRALMTFTGFPIEGTRLPARSWLTELVR